MSDKNMKITEHNKKIFSLLIVLMCSVFLILFVYSIVPEIGSIDWRNAFHPASINFINGESPYSVKWYFNPPWTLIPLLPISFFNLKIGSTIIFFLNLICYGFVARKLKVNFFLTFIFLLFSGALQNSIVGNIDGIVSIGFILNPVIGLFFLLSKPQFGIVVILFWSINGVRENGLMKTILSFVPVTLTYLISFYYYGFYVSNTLVIDMWWNTSIFPYGIPIGLILFGISIWKKDIRWSIMASPFFSPYLAGHSWAVVWLGGLSFLSEYIRVVLENRK